MRKILFLSAILLFSIGQAFSQAKKPTLMVVPSDAWCNENGYMLEFKDQGTTVKVPDYKKAFQEDPDLILVISKINEMMAARDFPLKNMESVLKTLQQNSAEDVMMTSKTTGANIMENPIDKLKKVAKADIILQLTWKVNQIGPKKSVTFILQGLDSYTGKQIAAASGTGNPSFTAELPVLLEEAVVSQMDNFSYTLQNYFDDLFANGREVTLRIKVWNDWGKDLETEFGNDHQPLSDIIEDWLSDNTVKGRFSTTDATENMMLFEQVRIPLYYERNGRERAMDTRRFTRRLSNYLRNNLNIPNKLTTKGLGEAAIILGGK